MRYLNTGLLVIGIFLSGITAKAQTVDVLVRVPQYNQLYIADLDIQHNKNPGVLFTASLLAHSSTPLKVRLQVFFYVTLAGQDKFELADATSKPFTLNPGAPLTFTNIDLVGDSYTIQLDTYNFDPENKFDQIKNVALATGKAPAGTYEFNLRCVDAANPSILEGSYSGQIVVTNPSRVDLILPMNEENITTLFPHFQWLASADTVTLSIYQQLFSQQNAQDVVSGVPYLQQTVSGSSFNYPPSGAGVRPLNAGKAYFWFVDMPSSATRGAGTRSDIWSFTIASVDTSNRGSSANAADAAAALQNFLSGTQFAGVLSQIGTLTGTAVYDGNNISIQDLVDLLKNMDKSKITNVTIQ